MVGSTVAQYILCKLEVMGSYPTSSWAVSFSFYSLSNVSLKSPLLEEVQH